MLTFLFIIRPKPNILRRGEARIELPVMNPRFCLAQENGSPPTLSGGACTRGEATGVSRFPGIEYKILPPEFRLIRQRRWSPASHNCRGFLYQSIIQQCFNHEQSIVHPPGHVALEDGVSHVPAPYRQSLAFAFLQVAPTHHRPAGAAVENPPAGFNLVVDVDKAGGTPQPPGR